MKLSELIFENSINREAAEFFFDLVKRKFKQDFFHITDLSEHYTEGSIAYRFIIELGDFNVVTIILHWNKQIFSLTIADTNSVIDDLQKYRDKLIRDKSGKEIIEIIQEVINAAKEYNKCC